MKKILLIAFPAFFTLCAFSQETPAKKDRRINLSGRTNDHFMIQYGWHGWSGAPDSLNIRSFSKTFNFYIMMDYPFKTDPRFSVAFGPGIGTDHLFFERTNVSLIDHSSNIRFHNLSDTNHFDKYKLASAFLELPVELRFSSNPVQNSKSFKVALGLKVGLLVDVHTKGKNWVDKDGKTVAGFDEKFIQKLKDKYFFNGNRLVGTARIGYGLFTLFGTYQLSSHIKEGLGPNVKPISIGLTLSGL